MSFTLHNKTTNNEKLKRIIRNAVIIRLIMLLVIVCSGSWESSFGGAINGVQNDDYKYEMGAVLFEKNAKNLFDAETFTWAFITVDPNDWSGYHIDNPLFNSILWYLLSCLLVWFTKTNYSIRLFNIILVALSMKYIYNFASKIWGEKVALKSCKLFAYLPYPIVFCCFGYKEELVLWCTFYLLSWAADYRKKVTNLNIISIVKLLIVALVLMGIRGGVSLALFAVCMAIMFLPNRMPNFKFSLKKSFVYLVCIVIVGIAFAHYSELIGSKAAHYVAERRGEGHTVSLLMINSLIDLWKLPLSYAFSVIMPISMFGELNCWLRLVENINICMVPISVGCLLYLCFRRKADFVVYWCTFGYYLIYAITSLTIPRHYAALVPLNLIYFSAFIVNAKSYEKRLWFILSGLMAFLLIVFFGLK